MSSRGAGRVYSGHVDRQAFKCMGHSKEGERLGCPVGRGGMVGRGGEGHHEGLLWSEW